jgi:hypothetical protein
MPVAAVAKAIKRTEGAVRQKAKSIGTGSDSDDSCFVSTAFCSSS